MLPFQTLLSIERNLAAPVYQQVANGIITLIQDGTIVPGTFLPSTRVMAEMLSLHRRTIVAAYEELAAQDWIETIPRKGMMIARNLPELKPRSFKTSAQVLPYKTRTAIFYERIGPIQSVGSRNKAYRFVINDGFPDSRIAPVDILLRQYRFLLQRPSADRQVMYSNPAGTSNFRTTLADFLSGTRGLNIDISNLLVTRGAQMAIYIAASMLIKPGSLVIVGEPNYATANSIFEYFGAKLVKVSVDENGIDVDAIEKICRKKKPALLYIIPHHHHPTTVTLSAARRMKLLSLIREYKLPVIEDDYDYDFHYARSPILPLASADHGGYVIYIGSITKCFASSIRMGYLVATEDFVNSAAQLKRMIDIRGDVLMEESLAILFNNGDMQKHLKKSLKIYQQRRDLFCNLLENEFKGKLSFTKPSGGMSVWVQFDKRYPLQKISEKASAQGLFMGNGLFYNTGKINYNALRMGFASLNEKEIQGAMALLKKIV